MEECCLGEGEAITMKSGPDDEYVWGYPKKGLMSLTLK